MSSEPAIVFEWDGETDLDESVPRPSPASRKIPDWYKNLPANIDGMSTVKLCSSFSDALRTGWIIPFPFDLSYTRSEDTLSCVVPESDGSVTEYSPSPGDYGQNSSFRAPEFKIDMPWRIHTPDGYSALITYPFNRPSTGVKAFSLLVETDSHDGRIPIPALGNQSKAEIEKGDPFLQVIPIKRDTLLSEHELTHSGESPDVWRFWELCQESALNVDGFYRRFCWQPKPGAQILDLSTSDEIPGEPDDDEVRSLTQTGDPVGEPEHIPKVMCEEENFDVFPKPKPASDYIPGWIEEPGSVGLGDEDQLITWMRDAMGLGWVVPIAIRTEVHVKNDQVDVFTEFDESFSRGMTGSVNGVSKHSPKQLGTEHPEMPSVTKIVSPWFTVTPPGYSMLGCEPLNHNQQFIRSYAGLVDSDRYMVDGNCLGSTEVPSGEYEIEVGEPGMLEVPIHRDSMITRSYITD